MGKQSNQEREDLRTQNFDLKFQINSLTNEKKTLEYQVVSLQERFKETAQVHQKESKRLEERLQSREKELSTLKNKHEDECRSFRLQLETMSKDKET